jgi:PTH1 family peptidyl-tRNA hydrolase
MDKGESQTVMIELAAFLGNPGLQYKRSRHNAAWLFAETLPFYASLIWKEKFNASLAVLEKSSLAAFTAAPQDSPEEGLPGKVHLIFPLTFMNLSGEAVAKAASFFKIKAENILVVHDELELPLGTVSLKYGGGLGGHNGLRSIKTESGTADFWRLRIGIGRPGHRDIHSWVLSGFSGEEDEILGETFKTLGGVFIETLIRGPEALLPEWKKKNLAPQSGLSPNKGGEP